MHLWKCSSTFHSGWAKSSQLSQGLIVSAQPWSLQRSILCVRTQRADWNVRYTRKGCKQKFAPAPRVLPSPTNDSTTAQFAHPQSPFAVRVGKMNPFFLRAGAAGLTCMLTRHSQCVDTHPLRGPLASGLPLHCKCLCTESLSSPTCHLKEKKNPVISSRRT